MRLLYPFPFTPYNMLKSFLKLISKFGPNHKNFLKIVIMVFFIIMNMFAWSQVSLPSQVITDNGGAGTGTTTWTRDTIYILDGRVFVNEGDTLTIEPGTVIKGRASEDPQNASVLVVARGGYINACGTPELPIIFTAEADDVSIPDDVTPFERGLWGGVIVLGRATTNRANVEGQIEGIEGDARGTYGGDDDEDNSGVLKYISIRHGGIAIAPDNEINGLTLGAVGSGTTIEYIEVFANQDDGIEWFGGTVNTKWLSVAFCGDDSFDYDEGFRGLGQFWFTIQDDEGDRGGEHDGGTDPEVGEPIAKPIIYNATYLGADNPDDGSRTITMRDNAAGQYWNSIFADFDKGIDIELLESGTHSYDRFLDEDLAFVENIFFNINAGTEAADLFTISAGSFGGAADSAAIVDTAVARFAASFSALGNSVEDPLFRGLDSTSRTPGEMALDPRPTVGGPAYQNVIDSSENVFFTVVDYKGAFGCNFWILNWTALDHYGFLGGPAAILTEVITSGPVPSDNLSWSSEIHYLINGHAYVEPGNTLEISPGTIVCFKEGGMLSVMNGARIETIDTDIDDRRILFTSEVDYELLIAGECGENDPLPPDLDIEPKFWRSLNILGNSTVNSSVGPSVQLFPDIEGGAYGDVDGDGSFNEEDDSGILKNAIFRYGGLKLYGVGSGTQIEGISILGSEEGGLSILGGTPQIKYLFTGFNNLNEIKVDQGGRPKLQFGLSISPNEYQNSAISIQRESNIEACNFTMLGLGANIGRFIQLSENAQSGIIANSIVDSYGTAISIEDISMSSMDSYNQWLTNNINIEGNIFTSSVAGGNQDQMFKTFEGNIEEPSSDLRMGITPLNNINFDPGIIPITDFSNLVEENFVPSVSQNNLIIAECDTNFFDSVDFIGCLEPNGINKQFLNETGLNPNSYWIEPFLPSQNFSKNISDILTHFDTLITSLSGLISDDRVVKMNVSSNPFSRSIKVDVVLRDIIPIKLEILNFHGGLIKSLNINPRLKELSAEFDLSTFPTGYIF